MKLVKKYFIKLQKSLFLPVLVAQVLLRAVKLKRHFILIKKTFSLKNLYTRQPLFLNQKGISTLAPMILSISLSIGSLYVYKAIKNNQAIKERKEVYLCLKETEVLRRELVEEMGQLNRLIRGAFMARAIPAISPYAQRLQKVAEHFQQFLYFAQLKKAKSLRFCSSIISLKYIKNLPYKSRLFRLRRRLDGTVPLKKERWKEYLWSSQKNIFLQSSLSLESRFSVEVKAKRRELSKEAFLNLKESFGQVSSLWSL